jgi:hypothetical protein
LALGFAVLLILLQSPIRLLALWAMDASAEVSGHTATYFDIRLWSAPAALVNYVVLGWLLGVQRARTALVLQLLLNGTNILLDLVFVIGFGWEVAGVAWATLIAEAIAAVAGLALILHALGRRLVRAEAARSPQLRQGTRQAARRIAAHAQFRLQRESDRLHRHGPHKPREGPRAAGDARQSHACGRAGAPVGRGKELQGMPHCRRHGPGTEGVGQGHLGPDRAGFARTSSQPEYAGVEDTPDVAA